MVGYTTLRTPSLITYEVSSRGIRPIAGGELATGVIVIEPRRHPVQRLVVPADRRGFLQLEQANAGAFIIRLGFWGLFLQL